MDRVRRTPSRSVPGVRAPSRAAPPFARLLRLQATAGNRAVTMLIQRDAAKKSRRELPPIIDLWASSSLDQAGWKAIRDRAEQALTAGKLPEAQKLYARLLTDVAYVVGLGALPGFDPQQVHVDIGKHEKSDRHQNAKPGLNLTVEAGHESGHTGWVDATGTFGVPLDLSPGAAKPRIGIVISFTVLKADKALSLTTLRHEMVHATHHQLVLDGIKSWEAKGRKLNPGRWLERHARSLGLSDVDVAVAKAGIAGRASETEILAYVEGFVTEFHRSPPTSAGAANAFFQLLGVVETKRTYPWGNLEAKAAAKREAISRLRDYHATLGKPHRDVWKAWVDQQLAAASADTTGRKDFLTKLSAFVR